MASISLDSLIDDVEKRAPSTQPLQQLAAASAAVSELNDTTDALLSHFVDRSRRAGHSWSEIGDALGVSKQAVQKRFTGDKMTLPYSDRFTPRAKKTVVEHAEKAAVDLGQVQVGTEALLLGIWGEPKGLAALALKSAGADRANTVAALGPFLHPGGAFEGGYTPNALTALQHCWRVAVAMGHNYVGTEHLLLSLLSMDDDDAASQALKALGVDESEIAAFVKKAING